MKTRRYPPSRISAVFILLAGCTQHSTTFTEAEALAKEGKHEEAANKFDLVCALDPESQECPGSGEKSAASRVQAADKAITDGQYRKADRQLRLALLTADEATSRTITDRLASEDLKAGVTFEQAAADADKVRAWTTMETLANGTPPVADKAKAWMVIERPGILVARVKTACVEKPKDSCAKVWSEIEAMPQKPAGIEAAAAAREAERKRIDKSLLVASRFLGVFAERGRRQKTFENCLGSSVDSEGGGDEESKRRGCASEAWDKPAHERWDQMHYDDEAFRKALVVIADPAIVAELEKRKTQALANGEYDKFDMKNPLGGAQ